MSEQENSKSEKIKEKVRDKMDRNVVEREQFDKDGNLVCPTCKKSLRGLKTYVSDSLFAPDKHTTKKHKVQCCSEACTAQFHDIQQKSIEE
ncbi:MAG: hypothetical protein ACFCUE_14445 [Candidatus Bathyarchaeia archaeon]